MEREQERFRRGESTGKPIGGNVSSEPLPQALHALAVSRGYESQLSLANALGNRHNGLISSWYTGLTVPSPETMSAMLILFRPNDTELERIIEPWREKLTEGRGNIGGQAGTKRSGRKRIKPSKTPVGKWFENYVKEKDIGLTDLKIGVILQNRDSFSLESMSHILQSVPEILGLSRYQTEELAEVVASSIEEKIAEGHEFRESYGGRLKKIQQELQCITFTGTQAAEILGTSRANISIIRNKLGMPMLLTEDDISKLAIRLGQTKNSRRKRQNYYKARRLQQNKQS